MLGNLTRLCICLICMSTLGACLTPGRAADVRVVQATNRSVAVTGDTYTATIDSRGVFNLVVGRSPAFQQVFVPETGSALTIDVIDKTVAVRGGKSRVEYTFGPDTIDVVTEGFSFEFLDDQSLKAVLKPGGQGGPYGQQGYADTSGLVLANNLTVTYTAPFHTGSIANPRMVPSNYCNGSLAIGGLLEFTLKIGQPVDALSMLGQLQIEGVGNGSRDLLKDGNQGGYFTYFSSPSQIAFTTTQPNISDKPFTLTYSMSVLDHYVAGKTAYSGEQTVTLRPGQTGTTQWTLPALDPGFYYLSIAAKLGDQEVTSTRLTFAVDLPHYSHPLTRPADFIAFWKAKVDAMRKLPFDATLTPNAARSTDVAADYDLELTIADGSRFKATLQTPRAPGKYTGMFDGVLSDTANATDGSHVIISYILPESATFSRWTSKDDNNMLENYLLALRLTDYLRSRPDVAGIYLFGASRSGPIMFVDAALDPTRITAIDIHVPTSAGIGWQDKPYAGWGVPAGYQPTDPAQVRHFTAMAAYCDPVNFAPDVKTPWIVAYGILDDLARPEGIEAMFEISPAAFKRISRDPGGHQESPGFQQLEKDLAAYLKANVQTQSDEGIMTEH